MADELLNAAQQTLRLTELQHNQAMLTQQVQTSLQTVNNTLTVLQRETQGLTEKLGGLVSLQHSHTANKDAIDEMKRALGDLNGRLEEWFDDFDQRNEKKWNQYEQNRDAWRREHEANNENDKREMEREVRNVRETVIRWVGWGTGAGALVTIVVGLVINSLSNKFTEAEKDTTAVSQTNVYQQQLIDAQREKIHEVELYLARGGANPQQPYVTKQQRTSK